MKEMESKKNLPRLSDMTESAMPEVETESPFGILGTGDFARAMAKRLGRNGKKVLCGSRYPQSRDIAARDPELATLDVSVVPIPQLLQEVDVIILALHSSHLEPTLRNYQALLNGKILVDVSNPDHENKYSSQSEMLAKRYTGAHVVKAFNTISAYTLANDLDEGDRKVYIASDSKPAAAKVADVAHACGLETVMYGKLSSAKKLETMQKTLLGGWGTALLVCGLIFAAWLIYGTLRYHIKKGYAWSRWPINTFNKVFACSAMTILSLCYLPGSIASILQLIHGTKHRAFPSWLDRWMQSRKQMGLISLWLVGIHCIMSVAHLSPAYFTKWFDTQFVDIPVNQTDDIKVPVTVMMNWKGETAICLGTIAFGAMCILGISSLPSVGSKLNWKQWNFIQSYMGYFCLIVATAHVTMKGSPYWTSKPFGATVQGMSFLSLVMPYLTMFLRLVLLLPCFSVFLYRIRRGWECCGRREEGKHIDAAYPTEVELGVNYATVNKGVDTLSYQTEMVPHNGGSMATSSNHKARGNQFKNSGYEEVILPAETEN